MIQPIIKVMSLDFNVQLVLIKSKVREWEEWRRSFLKSSAKRLFSFYFPPFLEDAKTFRTEVG